MLDRPRLAVVIAAAGCGDRFGSDKMSERLGDRTVLETTVSALRTAIPTAPLVVVVASERLEDWRAILESGSPVTEVIAGGPRRQDSVRIGVDRADVLGAEIVVVHDGARPLVHPKDILAVLDALGDADGAVLCSIPVDTVKRIADDGTVFETLDRATVRLAQTPQIARVSALRHSWHSSAREDEWSDEAAVLEASGFKIRMVEAARPNPKITTPADLDAARALADPA